MMSRLNWKPNKNGNPETKRWSSARSETRTRWPTSRQDDLHLDTMTYISTLGLSTERRQFIRHLRRRLQGRMLRWLRWRLLRRLQFIFQRVYRTVLEFIMLDPVDEIRDADALCALSVTGWHGRAVVAITSRPDVILVRDAVREDVGIRGDRGSRHEVNLVRISAARWILETGIVHVTRGLALIQTSSWGSCYRNTTFEFSMNIYMNKHWTGINPYNHHHHHHDMMMNDFDHIWK